jgi:hypothetical protein
MRKKLVIESGAVRTHMRLLGLPEGPVTIALIQDGLRFRIEGKQATQEGPAVAEYLRAIGVPEQAISQLQARGLEERRLSPGQRVELEALIAGTTVRQRSR